MTNSVRYVIAAMALFAAFAFTSVAARAEAAKIAVVDVQKLMSESKAAKSIQEAINAERKKFEEEVAQKERTLREKEQALIEKQKSSKDGDKLEKDRKAFETELRSTQENIKKRKLQADYGINLAVNELRKQIVDIVAALSEKNGYQLVLSRQDVVLAEKELDVTAQVMTELDKKLPKVKVDMNAKMPEKGGKTQ